ncbi:MAG: phosphoribosylaminoimidazolesuccinocarboxamide synthase [Planctomycetota bacterium]|nr:phosphoribosylaminoimidazolesuccinocarboxamide synthase [Planctomycetota bacterium]MDA1212007.1 phosphoribosylaminoimidazolesuccinocarboxamide synthase [Planctomycetota bacterium]
MTGTNALLTTEIPGMPVRRGKVRDVYDFGDRLMIVATDRISAFDWILPDGIPDKGRILTSISLMWFDRLGVAHHLLDTALDGVALPDSVDRAPLLGRVMVVKKAKVVPIECVVRGYLAGSGWKEYRQSQSVCGVPLPAGLTESERLPEPIFTPATKEESGHDENISFERMVEIVGAETSERLKALSLKIYQAASEYALTKGIIIADTKFEFGFHEGELLLVDEVLTPDSSRFWPVDEYRTGVSPPSFDKQFVRNWLETTTWDKNSPPPRMPPEIAIRTREKYAEAHLRLTGMPFAVDAS